MSVDVSWDVLRACRGRGDVCRREEGLGRCGVGGGVSLCRVTERLVVRREARQRPAARANMALRRAPANSSSTLSSSLGGRGQRRSSGERVEGRGEAEGGKGRGVDVGAAREALLSDEGRG